MTILIVIIYLLGIFASIFLCGFMETKGKTVVISILWPIILPIFAIFLFCRSIYLYGEYRSRIKENVELLKKYPEFWAYLDKHVI